MNRSGKMILYQLSHKYKLDDHYENKDIGIYSSRDKAESAVNDLKGKSGFKDTMDGFKIKKYSDYSSRSFWIIHFGRTVSESRW